MHGYARVMHEWLYESGVWFGCSCCAWPGRGCCDGLLAGLGGVAAVTDRDAAVWVVAVGFAVEVVHFGRGAGAVFVSESALVSVAFEHFDLDAAPWSCAAAYPGLAHRMSSGYGKRHGANRSGRYLGTGGQSHRMRPKRAYRRSRHFCGRCHNVPWSVKKCQCCTLFPARRGAAAPARFDREDSRPICALSTIPERCVRTFSEGLKLTGYQT